MKVYKRKTREAIRSSLRGNRSFPRCLADLDAALADLIPRLKGEQFESVMKKWNDGLP